MIRTYDDAQTTAEAAAAFTAELARHAIAERGKFVMAVSGGRSPWIMLRALAKENVPWEQVVIAQVDERIAPNEHQDRNLTHIKECLPEVNILAMPVEQPDLEAAAKQYAAALPKTIDLIHLGLGSDGHTASLLPGDPALEIINTDVAITGVYQGRRRMTLTYPVLNRARQILWLVTGVEKSAMLERVVKGDNSIPAGRVTSKNAVVFADRDAAGG